MTLTQLLEQVNYQFHQSNSYPTLNINYSQFKQKDQESIQELIEGLQTTLNAPYITDNFKTHQERLDNKEKLKLQLEPKKQEELEDILNNNFLRINILSNAIITIILLTDQTQYNNPNTSQLEETKQEFEQYFKAVKPIFESTQTTSIYDKMSNENKLEFCNKIKDKAYSFLQTLESNQ
jgi:hypothetical protein